MQNLLLDELPAATLATRAQAIDARAKAKTEAFELPDGAIAGFFGDYRFLSNFWLAPVPMYGATYPSVEHAYQAAKSSSADERLAMLRAAGSAAAKALGRRVTLRPDWEAAKTHFMLALVRRKFADPVLGNRLIATGHAAIFEETTRWNDTVWGIVACPVGYRGGNRLGQILESVRDELMTKQGSAK
ncbi:MAG: NADAR family protein [Sphingomonadales bacterium]|nr:NADAR family protein [Sphingomonadales bacterium]